MGSALLVLVLEATRRSVGPTLPLISLLFVAPGLSTMAIGFVLVLPVFWLQFARFRNAAQTKTE